MQWWFTEVSIPDTVLRNTWHGSGSGWEKHVFLLLIGDLFFFFIHMMTVSVLILFLLGDFSYSEVYFWPSKNKFHTFSQILSIFQPSFCTVSDFSSYGCHFCVCRHFCVIFPSEGISIFGLWVYLLCHTFLTWINMYFMGTR